MLFENVQVPLVKTAKLSPPLEPEMLTVSPGRVSPKGSAVGAPPHSSFLIRDILNDPGHAPGAAQALFANSLMQQQLAALGGMGGLQGPGGLQGIPGSLLPRPPMFMPPRPVSPADSFDRGSDHDDRDDGEFEIVSYT